MPYRDRLNAWAIVRLLPNCQRVVVACCRNESDAEGYCHILRRLQPDAHLLVIFDPIAEEPEFWRSPARSVVSSEQQRNATTDES